MSNDNIIIHPAARILGIAIGGYAFFAALTLSLISKDTFGGGSVTVWRVLVLCGILVVGYVYFYYRCTTLIVSSGEVTKRSGILVRDFERIQLDKVTNVNYHRSALAMLAGVVNLKIESAGSTDLAPGMNMPLLSMHDVKAVMLKIHQEKEAFNERAGSGTPVVETTPRAGSKILRASGVPPRDAV